MTPQRIAAVFIVGVSCLVALGDIVLYVLFGTPGTISGTVRDTGNVYVLLPALLTFLMGCLFGHLFLTPEKVQKMAAGMRGVFKGKK